MSRKKLPIKPNTIGARIHQLREARGMTQKQFARRVFTNPSAVGYWESGRVLPSCEMIISICRNCCVTSDWLLGLDKPETAGGE
ncbi:MAG: helix-turn-helix transcriptional regulator [Clostridia bacterium]|nr:helix-turn-helix transcriptional regulator [Clostridia bacterium]